MDISIRCVLLSLTWIVLLLRHKPFVTGNPKPVATNERKTDQLTEKIFFQPLQDWHQFDYTGKRTIQENVNKSTYMEVQFDIQTEIPEITSGAPEALNFDLFSKEIAKLLMYHPVEAFTAVMSQGQWKTDTWGKPPFHLFPTGGTLMAKIPKIGRNLNDAWAQLTRTVGGITCATFSPLMKPELYSVLPENDFTDIPSFWPTKNLFGDTSDYKHDNSSHIVYGSLPSEATCTENLSPLAKLLPCRLQAGLGMFLDPILLAEADFKFYRITASKSKSLNSTFGNASLELSYSISFGAVIRSLEEDKKKAYDEKNRISSERIWRRFNNYRPCVAVSDSRLFVRSPIGAPISPLMDNHYIIDDATRLDIFDSTLYFQSDAFIYDGQAFIPPPIVHPLPTTSDLLYPDVELRRDEVESNNNSIRLRSSWIISITNKHPTMPKLIRYYEAFPPLFKVLLHTLRAKLNNIKTERNCVTNDGGVCDWEVRQTYQTKTIFVAGDALKELNIKWGHSYTETKYKQQFYIHQYILEPLSQIEIRFDTIKPHQTVWSLAISPENGEDFGSSILLHALATSFRWIYYTNAAFVRQREDVLNRHISECRGHNKLLEYFCENATAPILWDALFTEGRSILVALPDASMPFNVVTFTCTLLLLFYGCFFRLIGQKKKENIAYDNYRVRTKQKNVEEMEMCSSFHYC